MNLNINSNSNIVNNSNALDSTNEADTDAELDTGNTRNRIDDLRGSLGLGDYNEGGAAMASGTIYRTNDNRTSTNNSSASFEYEIVGDTPPPPEALAFWDEFYVKGRGVAKWDSPEFENFLPPPPPPPRPSDPLILDLEGDGIKLTSHARGTSFDVNGDGTEEQSSWVERDRTNGFDDAFLVLDKNDNGEIDSGKELFGDQNGAKNGYEELAKHDSNADGLIDANDDVYKELQLWADKDGDGETDEGELKGLEELGVTSISLKYTGTQGSEFDMHGNDIGLKSTFTRIENGEEKTLNSTSAFFVTDDSLAGETNRSRIGSQAAADAEKMAETRVVDLSTANINPEDIAATAEEDAKKLEEEEKAEAFRREFLKTKLEETESEKQIAESDLNSLESSIEEVITPDETNLELENKVEIKDSEPASENKANVEDEGKEDSSTLISTKDSILSQIISLESDINKLRSEAGED